MTVNITHFDGLSLEENVKNNFKQADMEAALAHILQRSEEHTSELQSR